MRPKFYIVSVKWTRPEHAYITFWRPDEAGYAYPLSWSGKYSEADVLANLPYYNNGADTIAVPCSVVDPLGIQPAPGMVDGDAGPVIMNNKVNRDLLKANAIRPVVAFELYERKRYRRAA